MLKLLFHRETLEILGIHCFGSNASEIIHIGQAIMSQPGDGQLAAVLHQHDVQLSDDGRSLSRGGAERLQPAVLIVDKTRQKCLPAINGQRDPLVNGPAPTRAVSTPV